MRIDGTWRLCEDGGLRPVFHAQARAHDGSWVKLELLADTGADRTVLSAEVLRALGLSPVEDGEHLAGIGGKATAVLVETALELVRENGAAAVFRGRFAAFTDRAALDMSVLGRDITNLFALIVDRPQDVGCLLGQSHRYVIVQG